MQWLAWTGQQYCAALFVMVLHTLLAVTNTHVWEWWDLVFCPFTTFPLCVLFSLWRKHWVWSGHWKLCKASAKKAVFVYVNCGRGSYVYCFRKMGYGDVALDTQSCACGLRTTGEQVQVSQATKDNLPAHARRVTLVNISQCVQYREFCKVVFCVLQQEPSDIHTVPMLVARHSVFKSRLSAFCYTFAWDEQHTSLLYIQLSWNELATSDPMPTCIL